MSLVLDSSMTLAWVYGEETTKAVQEVFARLTHRGAWVPGLWYLEIANVLEMGVRQRRHSADFRDATLADLAQLPVEIDGETNLHAWGETLELAERHQLTVYEAVYLELAVRRKLPIATLDGDLRRAALAENVPLLGM